MLQKIFDNDLVVVQKSEVTVKVNKPADVGICILDLSKVLTYEFQGYIKIKYGNKSRLDSLMFEIKIEDIYEDFSKNKKLVILVIIQLSQDDLNKLVFDKIKVKTIGVAITEFVGVKPKMDSFLVGDSSEHNFLKGVNKNVVARRNRSE